MRLGAVVKKKIPSPCWESNPRNPIIQHLVAANSNSKLYG
jgi:hypothetical protein